MYIDDAHASNSSMKSSSEEHDVKEATAALKGLLGLGTASPQSTPSPSARPGDVQTESVTPNDAPKQPKKKKTKKKKPATATADPEVGSTPPSGTSSAAAVVSNSNAKVKSKHHPSKKNKKKESENYSLSAFQSSPDASKLPMPSFLSSPPAAAGKSSVTTSASSPSPNEMHATSILENGEPDVQLPLANDSKKSSSPQLRVVLEGKAEPKVNTTATTETVTEEPASVTGVNLAAAIAAEQPPAPPMYAPPNHNGPMYPPPPHHHPMYHNPMPPQHAMYGTPPGYVTIPVQVPPHLIMPGRHMVVTSPAGYPVQVAVPEGIAPGMVIPVHVPVGPPLHMMPFPPPPYPNPAHQAPPSSSNQYPHHG